MFALTSFALALSIGAAAEVSVRFGPESKTLGVWKTTPTYQIVENPLLDREFLLKNGTRIPNPIHEKAWEGVRKLGADHVRFQPWFPYPHKAVPELDAPIAGKPTSWNFTDFMPQMEDFMTNTEAQGHSVVWNIGTIPCWMFWGPTTNGTLPGRPSHCPYPEDPEKSDFGYGERGIRPFFFQDPSGNQLADYYTRMLSYLINGYMIDEHGVVHNGGPAYNMSAANGHIFEFLNEGEHYYTAKEYVHDYDIAIPKIETALGERTPNFMGVGGCHDGFWNWWFMPNCTVWLHEFLDRSKHTVPGVPQDWASIHYYATAKNRSNPDEYTSDFFGSADKWLPHLDDHVATRDKLSPGTKLALTELGILMLDDMTKTFDEKTGGLPDRFFNAAAAFLAYTLTKVAIKGIEIATFSQYVGYPPIEKWGIEDMNFPSGTMIDWETGLGNAKYWVLKLFLDHVKKGDLIEEATLTTSDIVTEMPIHKHMCSAVGPWTFNNQVILTCNDPNARIDSIWADMGLAPEGACGGYTPNSNCTNNKAATLWAGVQCLGRHSCTLAKGNAVQQFLVCPEETFVKKDISTFSQRLTIQAKCTGNKGGHTSAAYTGDSVFSVGITSADKKAKKLLLVNKLNQPIQVRVDSEYLAGGATAYIVDPQAVVRASEQGIRQEQWTSKSAAEPTIITLEPFAVAMAVMNGNHAEAAAIMI